MTTYKVGNAIPVKDGDVLVQSECPNCGNVNIHHVNIQNAGIPQLVMCDTDDSDGCGKWYVTRVSISMVASVTSAMINI